MFSYCLGIGKQRASRLDIWPIPIVDSVIGYSCVLTTVIAREYSVLSTELTGVQKVKKTPFNTRRVNYLKIKV